MNVIPPMQLMFEFQVEVKLTTKNDVQRMLVVIYANYHRAKERFEKEFTNEEDFLEFINIGKKKNVERNQKILVRK